MDGRLTLTVVTPERAVVENVACDEVVLPGWNGELGILPAHTALITLLGIGPVTWRAGAKKESVAVRGGFADIANDKVRVLADEALPKDAIDTAAAAREKADAEAKRATVVGDEQLDAVNADARYAETKLAVAAA